MIRRKPLDPDFRREPKTDHWCFLCQKDLKPGAPYRVIRMELDVFHAIHPDDWEAAKTEITRPIEQWQIGPDCARRIGLEWSRLHEE